MSHSSSCFIQQLATASSLGYFFDSLLFPVCLPKSFSIRSGKSSNSACQQHIRNQGGLVTLRSFPRFLQCLHRFLQCVAYFLLRLHVLHQTGDFTAAVSGNLYLQLVVENDVPFSPVLGATVHVSNISAARVHSCVYSA